MLGVEVEEDDIILSAGTATGRAKMGKVYGFDKNGWPMMKYPERDWRSGEHIWKKSSAGFHVLVIGREALAEMQPTPELWDLIQMDYEADVPYPLPADPKPQWTEWQTPEDQRINLLEGFDFMDHERGEDQDSTEEKQDHEQDHPSSIEGDDSE